MSDETGKKERAGSGGIVKTILAMLAAGLLSFFGNLIWKSFETIQKSQEEISDRINMLEQDKSKWATLAEIDQRTREQQSQIEIMRQVWSYHTSREIPRLFPVREGDPTLLPPEDLFRDAHKYRDLMQQKYPNEPKKK